MKSEHEDAPAHDAAALLDRLRHEHALLEAQIEAFNRRLYLGAREQMERKRLQKMKLLAKDRISALESSPR
ncbi:MAG: DUF465 domain-containing protein [Myxococcales bacterium]|nr:DUF465 domain-containing protein [Myxococcales bacterium]MCB9520055.1 DUF465 domain-containing protein [Myxococcales bacterium]